jgi:hypothetical protein
MELIAASSAYLVLVIGVVVYIEKTTKDQSNNKKITKGGKPL